MPSRGFSAGMTGLIVALGAAGPCHADYTFDYTGNNSVDVLNQDTGVGTTYPCPNVPPPLDAPEIIQRVWYECVYEAQHAGLGLGGLLSRPPPESLGSTTPGKPRLQGSAAPAQPGGTTMPTLAASVPGLPFLGNQLVVLGEVPNTTSWDSATATYTVGLRRQVDCSLVEDLILPRTTTPNAGLIASLPAAQDNYHGLAGLTTTPDVFAHGCGYPGSGQPSSSTGFLLQPTATGGSVNAQVSSGSLITTLTDPVADTFANSTLLTSAANPALGAINFGKLTSSGNVDLVATFATDPATQQLATAVMLSNGNGTFKSPVYYDIAGDVTIDDVNGDGIPDIVICGATPGITTLLGRGDGTFTAGTTSATTIRACFEAAGQVLTGDFNGDGRRDLLVQGTVLLGNGDGTFTVGAAITTEPLNYSSSIATVAVGDLNGDGRADVVVSQPGFVALYYGKGDGTFTPGPRYAALPDYLQVSITDIDGDGNPDIVLGVGTGGIYVAGCCGDSDVTQPPTLQILMGRGDGTFVDALSYNQGTYGGPGPAMATADFNSDGKPDVLVFTPSNSGGQPGALTLLPGTGTGALGPAVTSPVNLTPAMLLTTSIAGSGKPDVVVAGSIFNAKGGIAILRNQAGGTFAQEQDYALADYPVSLAAGDFNGDGLVDLAVGIAPGAGNTGSSGVYVLMGKSDGTFSTPVLIDASINPTGLAVGDINGDGRADLVIADQGFYDYAGSPNQVNGAIHVYVGNANGTFTAVAAPTTPATNYSVAALGDLNGDGKADLILGAAIAGPQGTSSPSVYTLLGNGDGTFRAATATPLLGNYGVGTTSIALADFNRDGHLDIAVGDATAFTSVLLGNGDGSLTPTLLLLAQQPGSLAAVDLNGDGFPELLAGTTGVLGGGSLSVFPNQNAWPALIVAPSYSAGTVILPTLGIGSAVYGDVAVTLSSIDSAPNGTAPETTGNTYDPATRLLTVPAVTVGSKSYYNAVATVGGLVSIGSVSGADQFDGTYLSIARVQVGSMTYSNVVITPGKILGIGGGMPSAALDQYAASSRELLVPAVAYNGHVYTNVTLTVGTIVSVNGTNL